MSEVPDTRSAVAGSSTSNGANGSNGSRAGSDSRREVAAAKESFTGENDSLDATGDARESRDSFSGDTEESARRAIGARGGAVAVDGKPLEEFGPYVVYERLGQGGMATVHRAEKLGIGFRRPVALKRLFPHVAADPELVKLFVDEARLASHLHHANIAQTYELGRVGDMYFIAMEYASGPTLGQIMRQCQQAQLEIPLTMTISILMQVCDALDYAHNLCDESGRSLRIIHRDVSPANVLISGTGIVKLIDFGIAKATTSSVKTQTGFIKGKFGYIAPEYITGKIDARVDLFALGVIAHEMLAGRRLFEGKDDFETMANIRDMVVSPPSRWNPHVPADLDAIVMKALERDPSRRWQTAGAMQSALASAARSFGVVIGSQQVVEWVEWAFDQLPQIRVDSGPTARPDSSTDETNALVKSPRVSSRRESSVSIEVEITTGEGEAASGELEPSSADILDVSTIPGSRRAASSVDMDLTIPVEQMALVEPELLTPPGLTPVARASSLVVKAPAAPVLVVPVLTPTIPTRAVSPHTPTPTFPTPTPMRRFANDASGASRTQRPALPFAAGGSQVRSAKTLETAVPPPPPPPPLPMLVEPAIAPPVRPSGPRLSARSSRPLDGELPAVASSRDHAISVPPSAAFDGPGLELTEPVRPTPKIRSRSRDKETQRTRHDRRSRIDEGGIERRPRAKLVPSVRSKTGASATSTDLDAAAVAAPRRSVLWPVLVMLALGTGAMAAAYFWPDL